MPRRSKKILSVPDHEPPSFKLGDPNWHKIEKIYEENLNEAVRAALLAATQSFVVHRSIELDAEPARKSEANIKSCIDAAESFELSLAAVRASYAWVLVEKSFQDPRLTDNLYGLFVGRFNSLIGILSSFRLACDSALKELAVPRSTLGLLSQTREPTDINEGDEWRAWIRHLTEICKANGLSSTVSKGTDPNKIPFVQLVHELEQRLPVGYAWPRNSDEALRDAISRTRGSKAGRD
jgi:hypothetical protein